MSILGNCLVVPQKTIFLFPIIRTARSRISEQLGRFRLPLRHPTSSLNQTQNRLLLLGFAIARTHGAFSNSPQQILQNLALVLDTQRNVLCQTGQTTQENALTHTQKNRLDGSHTYIHTYNIDTTSKRTENKRE